ncbi:MAG TPA: serine/threonine-protein kinase [Gemmatimonadaceae bacterium]|nr:serine/threonine-protein kinase [Gemmatimonadaceae bacterium]
MSALKICPQCGTEYELDQRFCPKDGSTLKSQGPSNDLVGSVINKSYHVLRKLGEGGMGTVYLAEHVKMGRKSAMKVMNPGTVHDADAISRFNREAANASKISHPNVAAIYDFGETEDGLIFLAMEFIEGPSLTSVIKELGALPPMRAADIARQAADALNVAHDMGIVHRDLKPDNIMLAKNRDGTDLVKVVDFGIAKAANNEAQKVTKTGLVVGTPEYMSPEQLAGDKLDGRSDTYSLALVAFNMLTGRLPFPAETVQESMIMRLTERPKTLGEMLPNTTWPPQAQAVMDKALERDANLRYQTSGEFGRELFKSVSGMRASAATSVMSAASPPTAHDLNAATRPIPATRISSRTPPDAPAPVAPSSAPARGKTPMIATMAAVAVLAVGGGGYYVTKMQNAGAKPTSQTAQLQGKGDTAAPVDTTPLNRPVSAPAATPLDLDATLDSIGKLSDLNSATPATAAQALQRLDALPPRSMMTSDQWVLASLLRSEANITRGNTGEACKNVRDVQGASKGTKYENRVSSFLRLAC